MFNYNGKVALITGASSGIGKAYAEELASKGCHVILTARSKEKLDILAEKLASTYKIQAFINVSRQLALVEVLEII